MPLREIVFDIETTGFGDQKPDGSREVGAHRICSFAGLELIDGVKTGKACFFHVNPERDIPEEAARVNGLSLAKLKDEPLFRDVARELRDFVAGSSVIVTCHTMQGGYVMDIAFTNKELADAGVEIIPDAQWINVRRWGERMFSHKEASLNPMLDRYGIDKGDRTLQGNHGALKDAELLAALYPKLKADYFDFITSQQIPDYHDKFRP